MLTISTAIRSLIPAAVEAGRNALDDDDATHKLLGLLAEYGIPAHLPGGGINPAAAALAQAVAVGQGFSQGGDHA